MFSLLSVIGQGIKGIIKSPAVLFIYGVLAKWYIMVMLAAVMVTYWVLKGLEESGVAQEAYDIISEKLEDSKAIAQHCTPKIRNLDALWECVKNPPKYIVNDDEIKLQQDVDKLQENVTKYFDEDLSQDPYGESKQEQINPDSAN